MSPLELNSGLLIFAYLLGSIPFGLLVAKAKKVDLTGMPNLEAHFQRMNADPAVAAALAAEGLK